MLEASRCRCPLGTASETSLLHGPSHPARARCGCSSATVEQLHGQPLPTLSLCSREPGRFYTRPAAFSPRRCKVAICEPAGARGGVTKGGERSCCPCCVAPVRSPLFATLLHALSPAPQNPQNEVVPGPPGLAAAGPRLLKRSKRCSARSLFSFGMLCSRAPCQGSLRGPGSCGRRDGMSVSSWCHGPHFWA